VYTCIEAWLRRMYAAANGLTVEALVARTDTLHLTLEQVGQVINMAVASATPPPRRPSYMLTCSLLTDGLTFDILVLVLVVTHYVLVLCTSTIYVLYEQLLSPTLVEAATEDGRDKAEWSGRPVPNTCPIRKSARQ
jgi:hypothetical protein